MALNALLEQAFTGTANASCEVSLPSEGIFPRSVRVATAIGATGEECRVIVVDITKFKDNEARLEDDCLHLEAILTERTADLMEANIRMQQDIVRLKEGKKARHEAENRYHRLLTSITSYVYRVDIVNGVAVHTAYGEGCRGVKR